MASFTGSGSMVAATLFLLVILSLSSQSSGEGMRVCGHRLIQVLKRICKHRYHTPSHAQKRAYELTSGAGIVDKCCHRMCSYNTLVSYCEPDDSSRELADLRVIPSTFDKQDVMETGTKQRRIPVTSDLSRSSSADDDDRSIMSPDRVLFPNYKVHADLQTLSKRDRSFASRSGRNDAQTIEDGRD